jgi:hypothetical protein
MLIECPECRKSVSDQAVTCPQCGYQLLGRENMVRCRKCNADVIPENNPHDTISKFCPLCGEAITNLALRWIFLLLIVAILIGGSTFLCNGRF